MADDPGLSRALDAIVLTPIDDRAKRDAALTVCEAMHRAGDSNEEIYEVLASLDLLLANSGQLTH